MMKTQLINIVGITLILLTSCKNKEQDLSQQVQAIHDEIVSIDTHTDTPLNFLDEGFDIGKVNDFEATRSRIDLPRMKEGRLDAAFFAVFVGQGPRDQEGNQRAWERAMRIFHSVENQLSKYPDMAGLATTSKDAERLKKEDKRAIYIGVENGYPIGRDLNKIDTLYNMGARYITLSHTRNNDICDSSTDPNGPEHGGLSKFGKQVVKRMNDLNMIIDVSHISDNAFYDVIEQSDDPVIASHSCVRALCDNPRNLNDDMLYKLKENSGVIQICFLSDYLKEPAPYPERDSAFTAIRKKYKGFQNLSKEEREQARKEWRSVDQKFPKELATVSDIADHIDYVVDLIGIDYVGIGTDFDGGGGVADCKDASGMKNVTAELIRRGYSNEEIEKIWGGNFLRVYKAIEN